MASAKLAAGAVMVATAALVSTPLMSRYWAEEQLTLASIALLAHSLLGAIDLFRPVIVRRVSVDRSFGTAPNLLVPSICSTSVIAVLLLAAGLIVADAKFHELIASISATIIIYGFYSPLWGLLDGNLRMAETYLIRSASVALLYFTLGLGSLMGQVEIIYLGLIGVNGLTALLFWMKAKDELYQGPLDIDKRLWNEAGHIFVQNITRGMNDFGDRIASSLLLPVSSSGGYLLVSDFASRVNFPSQLAAVYFYPILCHNKDLTPKTLAVGLGISASIIFFSVLFYLYGLGVYIAYFGAPREDLFWAFCCLVACFGIYSISYFGQIVLRSHSLDRSLSLSFFVPAIAGILYLAYTGDGIGLANIVIFALISKASAVLMLMRLYRIYKVSSAVGLLLCSIGACFVIVVLSTQQ